MTHLDAGSPAPDFALVDQHGREVKLSDYAGRRAVLLFFYPASFSGVCTGELIGLRDRLGEFDTDDTAVLAISCDSVFTQRALADRDALFFPLLADFWPHGEVASAYGVFDERSGAAARSSYVVDKGGVVRWSVHNPPGTARDLTEHAAALAAAV